MRARITPHQKLLSGRHGCHGSRSLRGCLFLGSHPSFATPLSAYRLAWLTPGVPSNRQAASAPGSAYPAADGLNLWAEGWMRFRGTPGKAAWHSVRMSRHGRGVGRARAERIPTVEAHRRMPPCREESPKVYPPEAPQREKSCGLLGRFSDAVHHAVFCNSLFLGKGRNDRKCKGWGCLGLARDVL